MVVFLSNKNDFPVKYKFTLIFRAGKVDKQEVVEGKLKANEMITGSTSGLYFIPYQDKRTITEVGITRVSIEKISEDTDEISPPG